MYFFFFFFWIISRCAANNGENFAVHLTLSVPLIIPEINFSSFRENYSSFNFDAISLVKFTALSLDSPFSLLLGIPFPQFKQTFNHFFFFSDFLSTGFSFKSANASQSLNLERNPHSNCSWIRTLCLKICSFAQESGVILVISYQDELFAMEMRHKWRRLDQRGMWKNCHRFRGRWYRGRDCKCGLLGFVLVY